jgi:DNA-binding beta-propeller fold protein YncE
MTQIGSGYLHKTDPNALVIGPTGLVFDSSKNLLYVASTGDNEIFSIANAATTTADDGTGTVVYSDPTHLHGPLALAMAPNGDLLTTNGDAVNPDPTHNSEIVEFTPSGNFVAELQVDSAVGAAFGIAVSNGELAAVDDNTNKLGIFVDSDTDKGSGGMGGMGGMGMNGM